MKIKSMKFKLFSTLVLLSLFLFSCTKDLLPGDKPEKTGISSESSLTLKAAPLDLPGRTLAANCFQCHGTNGYAGELKIAGQGTSGMIQELTEMKAKDPRDNIMNVHARAYTSDEIKLIADYFSKQ
ncbi:MAG: cytochrome c class I [Bacteroidota bacterium]|nr:cytochrome c class I [Bacteroidota bacterium]